MTILIISSYIITTTLLGWYFNKPKPDVIKKNGVWVYNKDFEEGDLVSIPLECIQDVSYSGSGDIVYNLNESE